MGKVMKAVVLSILLMPMAVMANGQPLQQVPQQVPQQAIDDSIELIALAQYAERWCQRSLRHLVGDTGIGLLFVMPQQQAEKRVAQRLVQMKGDRRINCDNVEQRMQALNAKHGL